MMYQEWNVQVSDLAGTRERKINVQLGACRGYLPCERIYMGVPEFEGIVKVSSSKSDSQ